MGWLLADRQSGALAEQLLRTTAERWHILPGQLSVHNDNGAPMIAKPVIDLWIQLNVTPSYSRPLVPERPLVSNDNPFSESLFKTVQYHPTFPGRFADPAQATRWMRAMERWYNWHHAHTGLGLMTPAAGHFGFAETLPDVSTYPVFSWTGPCVAPQIKGSCLLLFFAVVRGMRFQNGSRQGELDCRLHSPIDIPPVSA